MLCELQRQLSRIVKEARVTLTARAVNKASAVAVVVSGLFAVQIRLIRVQRC
jgi:hypothetical protein